MTLDAAQQYARQLNRDVADLVLASHTRVSPAQSLWNRYLRLGVRQRLESEFVHQPAIGESHHID